MGTKGVFTLKSSEMSYLALSGSFEYLCYGSTVNLKNVFTYGAGIDLDVKLRRQILTSEVDPRTARVKLLMYICLFFINKHLKLGIALVITASNDK